MRYFQSVAILCLLWAAGGDACCQPEKYTADYTLKLKGQIPMGGPTGQLANIIGHLTGSGSANFESMNSIDRVSGKVKVPVGDQTMEMDVRAAMGTVTDNEGTKIWLQGEVPMMGVSKCKYVDIQGGIPDNYQCVMDFYKKQGQRTYVSPNAQSPVRESYTVDENCIPIDSTISVKVPPVKMHMNIKITDSSLGDVQIENTMPADCERYGAVTLPQLQKGGPTATMALVGMASGQGGRKRALHHAVLDEVAKRSMAEIRRRMATRSENDQEFHRLIRGIRETYSTLFA